jgi:hypothetical protein
VEVFHMTGLVVDVVEEEEEEEKTENISRRKPT